MKFMRKPFKYELFHLTYVLMAIFLVAFLLPSLSPGAMNVLTFSAGEVLEGSWWKMFTYIFVHQTPWSLLGTLLVFFFFGLSLENHFGSWEIGLVYLGIGLGVSGITLALAWGLQQNIVLQGADAITLGVLIIWAAFNPEQEIWFFGIFPIKAKWLALGYFLIFALVFPTITWATTPLRQFGISTWINLVWQSFGALIAITYLALRHKVNFFAAFFHHR